MLSLRSGIDNQGFAAIFASMNPATQQTLTQLAGLFRERLRVIGDHDLRESNPDLQLEQLKTVSAEIEAAQKNLPPDIDPHFLHFLRGCSYQKALAWIETNVTVSANS